MVFYFLLFAAIGVGVGKFVEDKKTALLIIVGFAVFWGVTHRAIWGFVTMGELLLGYVLVDLISAKPPSDIDKNLD
jgi:hypothetical protein